MYIRIKARKCGATDCSQDCSLITVISHWHGDLLYLRKARVTKDGGRKTKEWKFFPFI